MDNDIEKKETDIAATETDGNAPTEQKPAVKVTLTKTAVIVLGILLGLVAINAVVSFVAAFIN